MKQTAGTKYTSRSIYVDIDTGEIISKETANKYYLITKTTKHVKYNELKTEGQITYTRECKRNPQQHLAI